MLLIKYCLAAYVKYGEHLFVPDVFFKEKLISQLPWSASSESPSVNWLTITSPTWLGSSHRQSSCALYHLSASPTTPTTTCPPSLSTLKVTSRNNGWGPSLWEEWTLNKMVSVDCNLECQQIEYFGLSHWNSLDKKGFWLTVSNMKENT